MADDWVQFNHRVRKDTKDRFDYYCRFGGDEPARKNETLDAVLASFLDAKKVQLPARGPAAADARQQRAK